MSCDLVLKRSDVDRMKKDLYGFIDTFPSRRTKKKIMEYASGKRRIVTGPRKGLYDPSFTPFMIEPIDNMSVGSSIEKTVFVKPVQFGSTTGVENGINYYIECEPADQMYLSGTGKLLERWVESNLDPSIESFGNSKHIRQIIDSKNKKKTGDRTLRKSYFGCSLDMVSARSGSDLRQLTKQIIWCDEVDAAPRKLTTGEGNFLSVIDGRVSSFGFRAKRYITSTPTTADSLIWSEFLKCDRRYFMVPCPICGVFQALSFGDDYSEFGLKGEVDDNGRVLDCYYMCRECGGHIDSSSKPVMLADGFWEPTAVGENEYHRSYSANSLYSPLGMGFDWPVLYKMWISAKEDKSDLISFTNLYKGEIYEDDSDKIEIDDIYCLNSGYVQTEVPDGVLFLTAGLDVQKGSSIDKKNPARIEMEVVGHGRGYKTWGIEYKVFYGNVMDPFGGAWDKLYKYCISNNLTYHGSNGVRFQVRVALIDSADYSGNSIGTETVYSFCKRLKNFFPSKGFRNLKIKSGEKYESDVKGEIDKIKYRIVNVGSDNKLVEIATVHYKDTLYSRLQKTRVDSPVQSNGFCDFPSDYPREYFLQLTAETKNLEDGSYSAHGKRNEALDCRVYSMAAADVFLETRVDLVRKNAIKKGATQQQANEKIRTPIILKRLEHEILNQVRMNVHGR